MTRVAIIGSPDKELAVETMERLRRWLNGRADIVFSELTYASDDLLGQRPELLFVLGGDGTLITAAHNLLNRQLPIVGINLGKLGFMTEFTIEQIEREGDFLFQRPLPITRRVIMQVRLEHADGVCHEMMAVNDCAVVSGPPFRMITVNVEADGEAVAEVRGDGMIVATASGSTAYNLAAGGPILEPTAEALILTPLAAHTLTFRPLVLAVDHRIVVRVNQANDGTTVAIDGHYHHPFRTGDRLILTRYPADFILVRNPRHSGWYNLRKKLMWGQNPRNGG